MNLFYNILLFIFFDAEYVVKNNNDYIYKYYPVALYCELEYGVPVSVQLAQAIMESGGGKSNISINSNNHFGIKYYKNAYNGKYYTDRRGIKWRSYNSVIESYIDHAKFLNHHYKKVCYKGYKVWSNMKGYGEPNYWKHINKIIEQKHLNKLDYYESKRICNLRTGL